MKGFARDDQLLSLCGLNCGLCSMRLGGYCPGCGGGAGNQACRIARCSLEHDNVAYCGDCGCYPCEKYRNFDDFDSFITHRRRGTDMERLKQIGAEAYHAEQREKIEILEHLLSCFNDGRRKTFFCAAVNLLELPELREAVQALSEDPAVEQMPPKEKSARAVWLLEQAAERRGMEWKLRRKK